MIILTGRPKSTQHIYKYACRGNNPCMYMTKDGSSLKAQYSIEAKKQWQLGVLQCEVVLFVTYYHGDKRNRDIDNYNKLVLDSLSGIVYEDDKQIKQLFVEKQYDKLNPRVEIELIEYDKFKDIWKNFYSSQSNHLL